MVRMKLGIGRCAAVVAFLVVVAGVDADGGSKSRGPEVAARVGGEVITVQEVDAEFLSKNMKLAQQMYDARLSALEGLIMQRALRDEAAAENVPVDTLIERKTAALAKPVTDADVQAYYDKNKRRMRGRTLEQAAGQIRPFLAKQKRAAARRVLLAQIKKQINVKIQLEVPRADVTIAANDPYKGPADAQVTIVEFSDFQ